MREIIIIMLLALGNLLVGFEMEDEELNHAAPKENIKLRHGMAINSHGN